MKIKEIILREQGEEQAKITKVNPDGTYEITPTSGGKPVTLPKDSFTRTPQGEIQVPNPELNVGTSVTLTSPSQSTTSSTTTPISSTSPTSSTSLSPNTQQPTSEMPVTEISDEENLPNLTNDELIQVARHNGIEDKLKFDNNNVLTNREEIINTLQSGSSIGGDPTDDFINDVEDKEYDSQLLEKIRRLSGL